MLKIYNFWVLDISNRWIWHYAKGIFSNQEDTYETLRESLKKHLIDIDVSLIGCVALFTGVKA